VGGAVGVLVVVSVVVLPTLLMTALLALRVVAPASFDVRSRPRDRWNGRPGCPGSYCFRKA